MRRRSTSEGSKPRVIVSFAPTAGQRAVIVESLAGLAEVGFVQNAPEPVREVWLRNAEALLTLNWRSEFTEPTTPCL